MKYRLLGQTGVRVSELAMGTMSFGGDADEQASASIFKMARDGGINLFDTADMYGKGASEIILGNLLGNERENIILATKAYFPMGDDPNEQGLSRKHLIRSVERSLQRLKTDYIDIFYLHRFDENTSLEESLRTLDDLVRQGKIRYPAISNFSAWQSMKALAICDARGWTKPVCIQPMYNLLKRQAEVELLPFAASEKLGVFPYSPLAAGALTGKYRSNGTGRLDENQVYSTRYKQTSYEPTIDGFVQLAQERGVTPVALAIAWVAHHPSITAPLIGARNTDQLTGALKAADVTIDAELYEQISKLSPTPPPATDRNEEKSS